MKFHSLTQTHTLPDLMDSSHSLEQLSLIFSLSLKDPNAQEVDKIMDSP